MIGIRDHPRGPSCRSNSAMNRFRLPCTVCLNPDPSRSTRFGATRTCFGVIQVMAGCSSRWRMAWTTPSTNGATRSPAIPPFDAVLDALGGWAGTLGDADVVSKRDVLGLLIQTTVPHRLEGGAYRLEIAWTPTGDLLRRLHEGLRRAA